MRSRIARILAIAVCLIAPLGWTAHTRAETSGEVALSGSIVPSVLTMTLSTDELLLGQLDPAGNTYDPGTSRSQPFPVSLGGGLPDGTAWFGNTPLVLTVTTPVTAVASMCILFQTNVIAGGISRLYMAIGSPASSGTGALSYLLGRSLPLCNDGALDGAFFPPSVNQQYQLYPAYLVFPTDTAKNFSALVQFSVSAL